MESGPENVTVRFVSKVDQVTFPEDQTYILASTTDVTQLRILIDNLLEVSQPWAFKVGRVLIDKDILTCVKALAPKFTSECELIIEVFLLPSCGLPDSVGETPDAIICILPYSTKTTKGVLSPGEYILCLGDRANVSIKSKNDLRNTVTVITSEEPNSVALLTTKDEDLFYLITSCGIVMLIDVAKQSCSVHGKLRCQNRLTSAALSVDNTLLAVGDSEGSVHFYVIPEETNKRSLGGLEYKWVLTTPLLTKKHLFCHSVVSLRFVKSEEERAYILLAASLDTTLKVIDVIEGTVLNWFGTGKPITSFEYSNKGFIATGHVDGKVKVWQASQLDIESQGSLRSVGIYQNHSRSITEVKILSCSDYFLIVAASNDRHVSLIRSDVEKAVHKFTLEVESHERKSEYGSFPISIHVESLDKIYIGSNQNHVSLYSLKTVA